MTIEELKEVFKDVDENKIKILETMFEDFLYEVEQLKMLKPKIEEIGIPKTKGQADKKRYLIKEYNDLSQRHDSKIKIFLSALNKFESVEDNPMLVWLKERQNR